MGRAFQTVCLLVCIFGGSTTLTFASQKVVPDSGVTSGVVIRETPSVQGLAVGILRPDQGAEYLSAVPYWYEIKVGDARGYVAKRWTRLVEQDESGGGFVVDIVDVGTGLAIIIDGADFSAVYDGGSNDDLSKGEKNRLLAFLQETRPSLTDIDHIVLSHPHRDHVELLPDLLLEYQIGAVWDSGATNDICGYRSFITGVSLEDGVRYHSALNGAGSHTIEFSERKSCNGHAFTAGGPIEVVHSQRIDTDPVRLGAAAQVTFLHADGSNHGRHFNSNSLVALFELSGVRILVMGDAEAGGRSHPRFSPSLTSVEGELLQCCAQDLHADILIVGHHGSMTSSRQEFLNAVNAGAFVVSAGPKRYGSVTLPDAVVIEELSARGSVYRTDINDSTCGAKPNKFGIDGDGKPGGCDNIRIRIDNGASSINYLAAPD